MFRSLNTGQAKTITGAALIIGAASFASRILGIIRDRIFAHQFGAGDILDVYYASFRIPDLLFNLLVLGALSAGFIPVFIRLTRRDPEEGWQVTNSILNMLWLILIIVSCVFILFADWIVPSIVPGFNPEKMTTTIHITRIMLLSPILLGISSVLGGVLQSFKHFLVYSLSPLFYNLGIIVGALFFYPSRGLPGLAWGVVFGAFLHLLVQIPSAKKLGFHYMWVWDIRNPSVREIGKLMIPRILGLGAFQINIVVMTILASTLSTGSVSIFNFANNLQYVPVGLIGISFAIAAFPSLCNLAFPETRNEFIREINSTVRQILFFIIPLGVLFLLLRAQIVRTILGSGKFDWTDTIATADTLAFFAFSFFAQSLVPLLSRAFYALEDTRTPLAIGFVSVLGNIIAGFFLRNTLQVAGLAAAFSIGSIIQIILLWIFLRRKIQTLHEESILHSAFKFSVAAILMAITIQVLKGAIAPLVNMDTFMGIATQGITSAFLGLLVYGMVLWILKSHELYTCIHSIQKRFLQKTALPEDISSTAGTE